MATRDPRISETFIRSILAELPKWRDRRLWVLGEELRVAWTKRPFPPFGPVIPLYTEAKLCYIVGAFSASVAMAMAAVEALLRANTGTKGALAAQIAEARRTGLVPPAVADELDYLRELVRNPVAHGREQLGMIRALGVVLEEPFPRPDGSGHWAAPAGRFALSLDEAARKGLLMFLDLVQLLSRRS